MSTAVIVSAVRTAIGSFGGALAQQSAPKLGAVVIREALRRAGVEPAAVEEVILGNVLPAGAGLNIARQAALQAGLPQEVPAYTVNKACGSGLKTVALAAQSIMLGDAEIVVAGGTESMSGAPYLLRQARFGYRLGNGELLDHMAVDALICPSVGMHMGATAENIAAKYSISRQKQDEFAAASQQKAVAAIQAGRFKAEIVPVEVPAAKKGETLQFDTDAQPRPGTTAAGLAKLLPAFKGGGTVTPGNTSGINDGAAAVVVMSETKAQALGLKPLARIRAYATVGVDPALMGLGPWPATERALAKAGLTKDAIDLWELNEAFAAQSLGVLRELQLPMERVNVNGGAIALGHPVGASGCRILVTLLYAMQERDAQRGVATLCIGGGQGIAMVVERPAR